MSCASEAKWNLIDGKERTREREREKRRKEIISLSIEKSKVKRGKKVETQNEGLAEIDEDEPSDHCPNFFNPSSRDDRLAVRCLPSEAPTVYSSERTK